jgi:hypothetical protein
LNQICSLGIKLQDMIKVEKKFKIQTKSLIVIKLYKLYIFCPSIYIQFNLSIRVYFCCILVTDLEAVKIERLLDGDVKIHILN